MVTHPFQVSMHDMQPVHIHQTLHDINKLGRTLSELLQYRDDTTTYEANAVYILVALNELIDRPVFHPVRNHRTPPLTKRNTDQRKDIGMVKVSPDHRLFAEFLGRGSGKSAGGSDITRTLNSDGCFTVVGIELHNLDGHWTLLIAPFEHGRGLSAVHWVRH